MTDYLLELFAVYGLSVYFLVLVISSAGVPFPITLMLIVAGSFVEQGEMNLWNVMMLGVVGAVAGDNIGYFLGRFGGRSLIERITDKFGGEKNVERAEKFADKWGGAGVFFSRWFITPLGPWINLTSGATNYPWRRFIIWDILGETVWVTLYVMLGMIFSDRVSEIASLAGNLSWGIFGIVITVFLVWQLFQTTRSSAESAAG